MIENYNNVTANLDDLLLDMVTAIELSPRDREIAEKRYRQLKNYLERGNGPIAALMKNEGTHIYAQGSIAIGATIIHGDDDDRFDLDALLECKIPFNWSDDNALDYLFDALQGFPGAVKITRCTRCVQIQFAFMHMDVTVLDPTREPAIEHAGEIFHSPDNECGWRVPAAPYEFSKWVRETVSVLPEKLIKSLGERRNSNDYIHLSLDGLSIDTAAQQHDLPDIIPPRMDSEQILALKLLKRFMNLHYAKKEIISFINASLSAISSALSSPVLNPAISLSKSKILLSKSAILSRAIPEPLMSRMD